MKLIMFSNVKGGVGKTSSTLLTAYELASRGKKILIIDADLQSNCTQLLYKSYHEHKTLLNAIIDSTPLNELIVKSPNEKYPNIDLVPADIDQLFLAGEHLSAKTARETVIARYLGANISTLNQYDYVFVDLAPSIDILTRNFIYVADGLVIPIAHGDVSALRGANRFISLLKRDLKDLGMQDNIKKVAFISKHQNYRREMFTIFNKFLNSEAFTELKGMMLKSHIDNTTKVEQAVIYKMSIKDYLKSKKQTHIISTQMDNFVDELINEGVL